MVVPDVLTKSNLNRKVSAKLTEPYNVMSTFFFRRSVEKAFQLDESPPGLSLNLNKPIDGNAPYIISAVDDVMYIVSTVLQKSVSTSQKEVVAYVLPSVARILGSDFIGMIQRKMRDESYPKPNVQGGMPPEDKIVAFIVQINSLDVSNEYLDRIVSARLGTGTDEQNGTPQGNSTSNNGSNSNPLAASFPFDNDVKFVTSALRTLHASFAAKTSELLADGLQVLFNNVVKLRLRQVLADTFRDADYTLTEEELLEEAAAAAARHGDDAADEDEVLDRVQRQFERGWDALMKPLARLMTPRSYGSLLDLTAKHLARVLEKRVWSIGGGGAGGAAAARGGGGAGGSGSGGSRINAYGAIRMERDFNGIVGVVARGNYALREVFAKVSQILMVANMEDEEWEELGGEEGEGAGGDGDDGMHWVLDEDERRRARNLVSV